MIDLLQVLLMIAIPASVLLWCRFLSRRDARRDADSATSSVDDDVRARRV